MASLYTKVRLYALDNGITEEEFRNFHLVDTGDGAFIDNWDFDIPKPTESQLASYDSAGDTFETNAGIDATRRSQYGSWESQMEMIYKDQKNGTTTFKDHCDKVRSDNPKE